ncbi:hypothetical protein [Dokdonella sp.]|uniref:hypothetical protein n=1 Tax=Dokdonella sp. TaxID=2291710 RepID=UPI002F4104B8
MRLLPVYRVTVHVPPDSVQRVVDGVCAVDDLRIGDYAHSAWISAPAIEQFRPLAGANPTLGDIGELVRAPSVRIEFCIPRDAARLARLVDSGIRPHHPWSVPAIVVDEASMPVP